MRVIIVILFILLISNNAFANKSYQLSIFYNKCIESGLSHEYCKCNVEVMDKKLSFDQYKNLIYQSWKFADWMKENVIPICGYR